MDYGELLKELRHCADADASCSDCKRLAPECEQKIIGEAADAIEKLQQTLFRLQATTARAIIEAIPAADAREVVLCVDCVHYVRGELFGDMVCDYHYQHQYHMEENDFCSKGKKREEQNGN